MYTNYINPMTMSGQYQTQNFPQKQEIVKVNGENGAKAYNMMPNSSALLLDVTQPLVWLVQSDGAGYKSVTAYEIKPYTQENISSIEERLSRLEEIVNAKSNSTGNEQKK